MSIIGRKFDYTQTSCMHLSGYELLLGNFIVASNLTAEINHALVVVQ